MLLLPFITAVAAAIYGRHFTTAAAAAASLQLDESIMSSMGGGRVYDSIDVPAIQCDKAASARDELHKGGTR